MLESLRRAICGPSDEELMQTSDEFNGANLDTYTINGDIPNDIVREMQETNNQLRQRGYLYSMVEQRWTKQH